MNKLPININDLINARTVEWERLEFKEGWNPEKTLHTMCAFANDFHNLGGGYIIIGIREKNGRPVLPPKGLNNNQVDKIQKEVIELGYKIQPYYHPIVIPCTYKRKNILVLWAVGGQTCPYKVPVSLSKSIIFDALPYTLEYAIWRESHAQLGPSSLFGFVVNWYNCLELTS